MYIMFFIIKINIHKFAQFWTSEHLKYFITQYPHFFQIKA